MIPRIILFMILVGPCLGSDGQDLKRLGELKKEDLAVHFELDDTMDVLESGGYSWFCTTLTLKPEDAPDKFSLKPLVQYPWNVPKRFKPQQSICNQRGGVFARLDRLMEFLQDATSVIDVAEPKDDDALASSATDSGSCKADASQNNSLYQAIKGWNDRFFNMDNPDTRAHSDFFHGRGSEESHLAMEVSYFDVPEDFHTRITRRILDNPSAFFQADGAGKAGTTGASFIAGNVGLGNRNQGANLMDLLFPSNHSHSVDNKLFDADSTGLAQDSRRKMFGEAVTDSTGNQTSSPDLQLFEQIMKETIAKRSDATYLFGSIEDMDFQFQHRLWRFGPKFDAKSKGGIWHRDTCPFGVNGALPEGAIMFTLVYILYTENLDYPTAGTRVKDMNGNVFQLPCQAGRGNMIRSGEDDVNTFFHSGPLAIRSLDPEKPAYRVMMQSKTLVRPKGGRKKTIPQRGHWRGLGITKPTLIEGASTEENKRVLQDWLSSASTNLSYGIGESNALGSAAYPLNVHRAWSVTRDLCGFLGFKTAGFLPEPDKVNTAVMMFGFGHHSFSMVRALQNGNFRVASVASEGMYSHLFEVNQDAYANMHALDIHKEQAVQSLLEDEPFDMHLVIDIAPGQLFDNITATGKYTTDPVLLKYGSVMEKIASRPRGEGRIATVTYLSQFSPILLKEKRMLAEKEWLKFGEENNVRIVIMRVADRVYGWDNSALGYWQHPELYAKFSPCKDEPCTKDRPLTRVHEDDLAHVVKRMLSMYDLVETHGSDSSMQGTASLTSSITRFPSGTILNVIDDGPPDNMYEAEMYTAVLTGSLEIRDLVRTSSLDKFSTPPPDFDPEANKNLKRKLGYKFIYPSYREGAAKMFGSRSSSTRSA